MKNSINNKKGMREVQKFLIYCYNNWYYISNISNDIMIIERKSYI